MQDPGSELPRTPIPRTRVNKAFIRDAPGVSRCHYGSGESCTASNGWRKEYPYGCAQTLSAHHVLCLNLRAYVGTSPVHRLLCGRPASGRPYRDPPYPGPRRTQGVWLTHHPLARQVVLVRGGHRVATSDPPAHRGAEPRGWGGHPAAAFHLLFQLSAGFCAAPHQPCRWTSRRGAGLARVRPPWAAEHPLAFGIHSHPRGAYNRLASAPVLLGRGWLAAVDHRGGHYGAANVHVRGHLALQPHRRQRADDHHNAAAEGSIQAEGWVYIVLWLAVVIGLVIFDWRSWRGPAPAPATLQPAYGGESRVR